MGYKVGGACAKQATAWGHSPKHKQAKLELNHNAIHSKTSHKLSKEYIFHKYWRIIAKHNNQ